MAAFQLQCSFDSIMVLIWFAGADGSGSQRSRVSFPDIIQTRSNFEMLGIQEWTTQNGFKDKEHRVRRTRFYVLMFLAKKAYSYFWIHTFVRVQS